jgi:chemotaxis methyl-accepting protein methylase
MDSLEALLEQVRRERDLDLSSYKSTFIARRLAVRMQARDCADYSAYGRLLRQDPAEYKALFDSLSINLTRFFRDPTTFQSLEECFLPELVQSRAAGRRLRAWSAGCAGGEEPYSLAILLREVLGPALGRWQVEILATDVDDKALAQARTASYDAAVFEDLPPHYQCWIGRYFTLGSQRQLSPELRSMVTLLRHDLTRDPPPAGLDLILCRNVLIYFDRDQQDRLYQSFYDALRPEGLLVLGKTEILPMSWSPHFAAVELREHIYRRKEE